MPVAGRQRHQQARRSHVADGELRPLATSRRRFQFVSPLLYTDSLNQDIQAWIDQLRSGDTRALSRAISTVENRAPGWSDLLKALFPHSGKARVLGLTGAPGAGKSTLVDHLARHYRKQNRTVGIIAVDPTSPYTGGADVGGALLMQPRFFCPAGYVLTLEAR